MNKLITALAFALAASIFTPAQAQSPTRPPMPDITLPAKVQGQAALNALGRNLPAVAAHYGMSVADFTKLVREDRTVWLDKKGRVFFQDDFLPPADEAEQPAQTDPLDPNLAPLDQTFKLHSKPTSKKTIYLNFVGATLTGTNWNTSTQPTIVAEPYNFEGSNTTFSTAELQRIQYIWKRVAEDFAAFDVNITTEPQPVDKFRKSAANDQEHGTWVLITRRTFYDCSCGGVAYYSAFDDAGDNARPALVFYDMLGGNEKYVADAISHEIGHNVNLRHDGRTNGETYYRGHGSGATAWAPIMGVAYSVPLGHWSKGEYNLANNTQDDYLVMDAIGLKAATDDHGNATSSATQLANVTPDSLTGRGIIERPSDVDFFKFTTAGPVKVTVNVTPSVRGPKLDVLAELRGPDGVVLSTSTPVDSLPASITHDLPTTGTYKVTVNGTGKGDPLGTGYTDYGSVGYYKVDVVQTTLAKPPVAVLAATPTTGIAPLDVNFNATNSTDPDGTVVGFAWNFGDGQSQTGGSIVNHRFRTPGTYSTVVTVTDNSGLTDTESVVIAVAADTVAPNISWVTPLTGSTITVFAGGSKSIPLEVTATDNKRVSSLGFYVNDVNQSIDFSAPWKGTWNVSPTTPAGTYRLRAKAYDPSGNFTNSTITVTLVRPVGDITPPTVTWLSPLAGAAINTQATPTVTLSVNATDDKKVTSLGFYVNDTRVGPVLFTAPWTTTWNVSGLKGTFTLRAKAYDAAGNFTNQSITVTLN